MQQEGIGDEFIMKKSTIWRTILIDTRDDSSDAIVELPVDLLTSLGWAVSGTLCITSSENSIRLEKVEG